MEICQTGETNDETEMDTGTGREKTQGLNYKCINLTKKDQPWRGNTERPDETGTLMTRD